MWLWGSSSWSKKLSGLTSENFCDQLENAACLVQQHLQKWQASWSCGGTAIAEQLDTCLVGDHGSMRHHCRASAPAVGDRPSGFCR